MASAYSYTPYFWPSIVAVIFLFALSVYSFRNRHVPGALPFSIACMLGLLWSAGSIFEIAAVDIELKIFWRKFQVLLQLPSATAITCFLLEYAWPKRWLTRRNLLLLSIMPLLVVLAIATNNFHHLFWKGFVFDEGLVAVPGPLMKFFIAYVFINFLINLVIFVWLFFHSPQNRWPAGIMVTGQIIMRLLYFIDIADVFILNFPYAVFGISITSLMYSIVFFRYQILGPIPLARQAVVEQLPIGTLVLDYEGRVNSLNPAMQCMLKVKKKDVKGLNINEILPENISRLVEKNSTEPIEFEWGIDGGKNIYLLNIVSLRDWRELEVGKLLLLENVTEQRESQIQIIEQQRVMATLQEREQISRELHDDLAQVFVFIATQGQTIQRLLNRDDLEAVDRLLARLVDAAHTGEVDIRETIRGMRVALSEHGLLETLKGFLLQFEANTAIDSDLIISDGFDINLINPMVEVHLLRIIQESLANIRKHANATIVQIIFDVVDSSICVTIQDDGRGFEVNHGNSGSANHFGLKMMRERAQAIRGEIKFLSHPGRGTEIKICVPLKNEEVVR